MRLKVVPAPPASLGAVATVRDALPRVPRSGGDCCARIAGRVEWIADREAAREWLLLLRVLGLAARTTGGAYVRGDREVAVRDDSGAEQAGPVETATDAPVAPLERADLASRFRTGVLGAGAVLDALDDEPRGVDAARQAVESELPAWERRRSGDRAVRWHDRVERLLGWWILLGEVRRAGDGFVRVRSESLPGED